MNILNINRGNLNQENINSKLSIQLLLVLLILSNINRDFTLESKIKTKLTQKMDIYYFYIQIYK